ncbi:MAG TPA: MFS transporter [Pseudomonas sp.]|nr:MFS transporter [Pseudomonas sp.]
MQILVLISFTFLIYFCIGLPLAVLPGHVHDTLGYGSAMAGLVIGIQYLTTLLSRPLTSSLCDRLGSKLSVICGLLACALSGLLTLVAPLQNHAATGLALLLVGRVLLGVAQGFIGTGSLSWAIARAGAERTARVLSWNGVAVYGAIAVGAPLGMALNDQLGTWSLGAATLLLALLGLLLVRPQASSPVSGEARLSFLRVFGRVLPGGLALALGTIGYGTLSTFVALYFSSRGWEGAGYTLTAFGAAFIGGRLVLADSVRRFGGYPVAIGCLLVEILGLVVLWLAATPWLALTGATLTGLGLAMLYPALAVEIIQQVPASSRSAALGAFALFFDLALGIAGPLMGLLVPLSGLAGLFAVSALFALAGLALGIGLLRAARHR